MKKTKMNKIMYAVVALGATLSFGAQAESSSSVQLHGELNAQVQSNNYNGSTEKGMTSNTSYIGISAKENLGSGLKVFADVDFAVNVSDGENKSYNVNNSFNNEDKNFNKAVIGLTSNSLGTLSMGRTTTAYTDVTKSYDVMSGVKGPSYMSLMGTTIYATDSTVAGASFNNTKNSVLSYATPKWNGLTGQASWAFSDSDTVGTNGSLAAKYENGPWSAAVAFETQKSTATATTLKGSDKAFKVAGGYNIVETGTRLTLGAERIKNERLNAVDYKRNAYTLGVHQTLGNQELMAAYTYVNNGKGGDLNNSYTGTDRGAQQLSVGYKYNLSKRTAAIASANYIKNDANANYNAVYNNVNINNGQNITQLAVGLSHSF